MNEQDIVNKLKSDPRALKSVMQSQDGQALLRMLSGGNSAALGQAARQAASGDTAALSAMLSRVLSSPQGAELVQRLESKLQQYRKGGRSVSELDEKRNALLSDPGSMAQIMQLAQQLSGSMGGDTAQPAAASAAASPPPPPPAPLGGIDPQTIARYLPLLQELTRDTSQTTQLLYALRPFLKDGKQDKVERAARLARLITIGKRFLTEGGGLPV